MLENECKQLRRDMSSIEELKKTAEQQSRNYEQEVCQFIQIGTRNWAKFLNKIE